MARYHSKLDSIWSALADTERKRLAKRLSTSPAYIYKLARGHGTPNIMFAARMVNEIPGLTYEDIIAGRRLRLEIGRVGRGRRA